MLDFYFLKKHKMLFVPNESYFDKNNNSFTPLNLVRIKELISESSDTLISEKNNLFKNFIIDDKEINILDYFDRNVSVVCISTKNKTELDLNIKLKNENTFIEVSKPTKTFNKIIIDSPSAMILFKNNNYYIGTHLDKFKICSKTDIDKYGMNKLDLTSISFSNFDKILINFNEYLSEKDNIKNMQFITSKSNLSLLFKESYDVYLSESDCFCKFKSNHDRIKINIIRNNNE